MILVWEEAAIVEAVNAARYYAEISISLGERYEQELEDAVGKMCLQPQLYRKIFLEARKVNLESFPYSVVYLKGEKELRILSVMHLMRRPFYWEERLKE